MIGERGLVAAIKDTWRHEGYAVAGYGSGDERTLCLNGASWLAVMPRRTTSRKVLGLLAEHLGDIPDATAWTVQKGRGAQSQMMDMVLGHMDNLRRRIAESDGETILRTNMTWKGYEVWQRPATLKVTAYDPELVWIGVGDPRAYGDMLVWDDEGGLVVVLPGREIIGEELAAVLEQTPLV